MLWLNLHQLIRNFISQYELPAYFMSVASTGALSPGVVCECEGGGAVHVRLRHTERRCGGILHAVWLSGARGDQGVQHQSAGE